MLVAFAPSNEFQSTLPRGERLLHKLCIGLLSYISIHAPARGATPLLLCITLGYRISIHAPARGATRQGGYRQGGDGNFNPRSREGSDKKGQAENVCPFYFNPRSREGSDKHLPLRHCKRYISIHAPAKGATQHNSSRLVPVHNFNPRSREGSDGTGCDCRVDGYVISIHAPAKGATMCGCFHPSRES